VKILIDAFSVLFFLKKNILMIQYVAFGSKIYLRYSALYTPKK